MNGFLILMIIVWGAAALTDIVVALKGYKHVDGVCWAAFVFSVVAGIGYFFIRLVEAVQ